MTGAPSPPHPLPTPDAPPAIVAALLDDLAAASGNPHLTSAAAWLRARKGRRSKAEVYAVIVDDIGELLRTRPSLTVDGAAMIAARYAPGRYPGVFGAETKIRSIATKAAKEYRALNPK